MLDDYGKVLVVRKQQPQDQGLSDTSVGSPARSASPSSSSGSSASDRKTRKASSPSSSVRFSTRGRRAGGACHRRQLALESDIESEDLEVPLSVHTPAGTECLDHLFISSSIAKALWCRAHMEGVPASVSALKSSTMVAVRSLMESAKFSGSISYNQAAILQLFDLRVLVHIRMPIQDEILEVDKYHWLGWRLVLPVCVVQESSLYCLGVVGDTPLEETVESDSERRG
ncbi:hypothetical protein Taro_009305 [Colocasia esculenta]|uniref:Uncharacterized protein n=1 Tax=Colocasia esculenta TaxID=4460 RepID=A0A843TW15_COLES|nr:hypothetical protein [Colocasia esculenta]